MGILMFRVEKDRIQIALKEMNGTHSGMKNQVKGVEEKEDHYEVLVDSTDDYPFMTNKWEQNDFYGGRDLVWDKRVEKEHSKKERQKLLRGIESRLWRFMKLWKKKILK